ncbi:MAG: hypothetical protein EA407_04835 [Rhodobacteraceae bacterium]|nr:MAG: hypothetical protein EA407_04835 [Paracoccaceae bacterium]
MKPGWPALPRHPLDAITRAPLSSGEVARCLALLPAGAQIAIVTWLDLATRAAWGWDCVVPILCAQQVSVAQHGMVGQMTPVGRI